MRDKVSECIDLITEEIERHKNTDLSKCSEKIQEFDKAVIHGLEIARMILSNYWEGN